MHFIVLQQWTFYIQIWIKVNVLPQDFSVYEMFSEPCDDILLLFSFRIFWSNFRFEQFSNCSLRGRIDLRRESRVSTHCCYTMPCCNLSCFIPQTPINDIQTMEGVSQHRILYLQDTQSNSLLKDILIKLSWISKKDLKLCGCCIQFSSTFYPT